MTARVRARPKGRTELLNKHLNVLLLLLLLLLSVFCLRLRDPSNFWPPPEDEIQSS